LKADVGEMVRWSLVDKGKDGRDWVKEREGEAAGNREGWLQPLLGIESEPRESYSIHCFQVESGELGVEPTCLSGFQHHVLEM
jgi:hypothetical protein